MIRPTPPTEVSEHPQRAHDFLSNAPLRNPPEEHKYGSIQFSFDPAGVDSICIGDSTKRGRGRPPKNTAPDPIIKAQPKCGRVRPRKSQRPHSMHSGATSNVDTSS